MGKRWAGLGPGPGDRRRLPSHPGHLPGRGATGVGRAVVSAGIFLQLRRRSRCGVLAVRHRGRDAGRRAAAVRSLVMADQRPPTYVSGLDLGQASDFTALAVLEKTIFPDPSPTGKPVINYAVRHLERFPLGTAYGA